MENTYAQQKNYILQKTKKYIAHSYAIYNNSKFKYKNARRQEKIQWCKNFTNSIKKEQSLKEICRKIILIRSDLELILPYPDNSSYENSLINLTKIISFCLTEIQSTHKFSIHNLAEEQN